MVSFAWLVYVAYALSAFLKQTDSFRGTHSRSVYTSGRLHVPPKVEKSITHFRGRYSSNDADPTSSSSPYNSQGDRLPQIYSEEDECANGLVKTPEKFKKLTGVAIFEGLKKLWLYFWNQLTRTKLPSISRPNDSASAVGQSRALRWLRDIKDRLLSRKDKDVAEDNVTSPRSLDSEEIGRCALLSNLSYYSSDHHFREIFDQDPSLRGPIQIKSDPEVHSEAHLWLSEARRTIYVIFRGTSALIDVIHDLDFRLVPFEKYGKHVRVHSGFHRKLSSIIEEIMITLFGLRDSYDHVILSGHSLGGALATVASPAVSEEFRSKAVSCVSFGAPKVGDHSFVEWFNSKVLAHSRIINDLDPVPWLPFESFYHHVDQGLIFSHRDSFEAKGDDYPPISINDRFHLEKLLANHDIKTYISRTRGSSPKSKPVK